MTEFIPLDLFMLVIGGKPEGRHTEQHDVYFGMAAELRDLVPELLEFWPEMEGKMHIDSWRKIRRVQQYQIRVVGRTEDSSVSQSKLKLFFVNLGGYKPQDMEEYHYKQLVVAESLGEASRMAKDSIFWKHHDSAHIDDKYGIDVDDIYEISDLLKPEWKAKYAIQIHEEPEGEEDLLEIGYLKLSKLQ